MLQNAACLQSSIVARSARSNRSGVAQVQAEKANKTEVRPALTRLQVEVDRIEDGLTATLEIVAETREQQRRVRAVFRAQACGGAIEAVAREEIDAQICVKVV